MVDTYVKAVRSYQNGQYATALDQLHQVMRNARPRNQDLYSLLGNVCLRLGRIEEAAEAFASGATVQGPNAAMLAKFAMGLFSRSGNRARLAEFGPVALRLHPQDSALAFDHANALFGEGRYDQAAALAPRLDRRNAHHMALIINAYRLTGQFDLLASELELAHRQEPGNPLIAISRFTLAREMAHMEIVREHEQLVRDPRDGTVASLLAQEPAIARLLWSESDAINALPNSESIRLAALPQAVQRRPVCPEGQKMRIGYLSSDFLNHATMRLFDEVLDLHDRTRFEITLFCHTEPNQLQWQRENFPPHVLSRVVPVGHLSDEQAAEVISRAGIDVLVDLKGHTMNARLGIIRLSDAPLKVTYLGYPGPVSGADIDYAITDRVVTPDEAAPFFEEAFCRLPESYQANGSARRPLPARLERAAAGLPDGAFVLASFNAIQKITSRSLHLWAEVLKAIPHACLWLLADRPSVQSNLLRALAEEGIEPRRVIFARNLAYEQHIARLGAADLGLDTLPYNGHTTTSDMLWAGLPVLTMKGHAFQARVSESLLRAAGLDDMTARDEADYVDRAAALSEAPQRIAALKQHLDDHRFTAPLFDTARFTAHLEEAFLMMAERARRGERPGLIDVPALPARQGTFSSRSR